jgi:nucleotide-binding universal stress UspA family protein
MIDIKIYGTSTPGYQLAKTKLVESLERAHLKFQIKEITRVQDIMMDDVKSVPAFKVDDQILFEIKANGGYNASLRAAIQGILKISNYGKMVKIIVPTDFSETSYNAYNYANHLAKDLNGVMLIAHIYYPTSTDVNQFLALNEEAERSHREKLENLVVSLNQDWIGNFVSEPMMDSVFKVGFPKIELAEMSKEPNTVMVMGTTGTGDSFKKIFGSLSMDMIDSCHCPLYLVPPGAHYPALKEAVYLSEDLKNDSLHFLYAGRLCAKTGRDLRILHFRHKKTDDYDVTDTIKIMKSYFPEVKYHIDILDTENLYESVRDVVSSHNDQLVILSTKHRNIFQHLFHKSVTEMAALHAVSPLLILSDLSVEAETTA